MLPLLLALGLTAHLTSGVPDSSELRGEALVSALRRGGYTIMLRHTKTDRSINEGPNYASLKRAQQRNLNDEGVRDAKLIGLVMKHHAIPVGEILSSEMYRTRETAEYVFGDPTPRAELQQLAVSPEQRALVTAVPAPGTNRVIVTHHFIIERYAPGILPGEIIEGEAAVVRAAGDGTLTLVGRFKLDDWRALAPAAAAATAAPALPSHGPGAGAPVSATHSAPGASVGVPATRAGRIAEKYVHAFNTGDPAAMRAFLEASMATNPDRPMEARLESYRKLYDDLGPLTVLAVESSAEDAVTLKVRSKQGDFPLTVKASADQIGRGASVTFALTRPH